MNKKTPHSYRFIFPYSLQTTKKYIYIDCIPYRVVTHPPSPPPKKECPGYNTKLYLIMRLQVLRSEECGVPYHCHYSIYGSNRSV